MKKILVILFLSVIYSSINAQIAKKITVNAEIKGCWVALISQEEANNPKYEYKWWSAWQEYKTTKKYRNTPATFKNVPFGKYILVIYNPASKGFDPNSGKPEETSDGVVLEEIEIKGNQSFKVGKNDFKAWNCLSCPWLFVFDGQDFIRQTEIIKDVVGKAQETTTRHQLSPKYLIKNTLKIKIQEEKEEISYLNRLVLKVAGQTYYPKRVHKPQTTDNNINFEVLSELDESYQFLKKGEMIELEFNVPEISQMNEVLILEASGYYVPDAKFLEAIYQKYVKK